MSKEVYTMGQYYLGYVNHNGKIKVFDNRVDGEWAGLKLMEHSYWRNSYVGQMVNDIYYNKGQVCWVGDYYNEDDYSQVNCDKELVKSIGDLVWNKKTKLIKSTRKNARSLVDNLLVNHTKKVFINGNRYFENNKWFEEWEGKQYAWCIHPLPLLTCSASHSGGSYYGINQNLCGTWFNDVIEVVEDYDEEDLIKKGYTEFKPKFSEKE